MIIKVTLRGIKEAFIKRPLTPYSIIIIDRYNPNM